jgi:hypothetical protein
MARRGERRGYDRQLSGRRDEVLTRQVFAAATRRPGRVHGTPTIAAATSAAGRSYWPLRTPPGSASGAPSMKPCQANQ